VFLIANTTPYFISSTRYVFNAFYYNNSSTFLYSTFVIFFFLAFIYILSISVKAYLHTQDTLKKRQIFYYIIVAAIGALGGSTNFLPVYGVDFYPYFNACIILFPLIIGYAILRHELFNLKVLLTELLVLVIWLILLLRVLLENHTRQAIIYNLFFLAIVIVLGIFIIKSTRKEVEVNNQLKELSKLKSEFISLATHHISTPLTAVNGYISLLDEEYANLLPKEGKDMLHAAERSTKNVINVTRDFLDVMQLDNDQQKYYFSKINLKDLVREVVEKYKSFFQEKGIAVELIMSSNVNNFYEGDSDKLELALSNIFANIKKYIVEGSIRIELIQDQTHFQIIITDTAQRSIPQASPKLHQKFTKSNNEFEANLIGSSLGLYVAKQIIEKHKGSLAIESIEEGTKFTITL
jgi:signal transduction histidine kinase